MPYLADYMHEYDHVTRKGCACANFCLVSTFLVAAVHSKLMCGQKQCHFGVQRSKWNVGVKVHSCLLSDDLKYRARQALKWILHNALTTPHLTSGASQTYLSSSRLSALAMCFSRLPDQGGKPL